MDMANSSMASLTNTGASAGYSFVPLATQPSGACRQLGQESRIPLVDDHVLRKVPFAARVRDDAEVIGIVERVLQNEDVVLDARGAERAVEDARARVRVYRRDERFARAPDGHELRLQLVGRVEADAAHRGRADARRAAPAALIAFGARRPERLRDRHRAPFAALRPAAASDQERDAGRSTTTHERRKAARTFHHVDPPVLSINAPRRPTLFGAAGRPCCLSRARRRWPASGVTTLVLHRCKAEASNKRKSGGARGQSGAPVWSVSPVHLHWPNAWRAVGKAHTGVHLGELVAQRVSEDRVNAAHVQIPGPRGGFGDDAAQARELDLKDRGLREGTSPGDLVHEREPKEVVVVREVHPARLFQSAGDERRDVVPYRWDENPRPPRGPRSASPAPRDRRSSRATRGCRRVRPGRASG